MDLKLNGLSLNAWDWNTKSGGQKEITDESIGLKQIVDGRQIQNNEYRVNKDNSKIMNAFSNKISLIEYIIDTKAPLIKRGPFRYW